MKAARNSANMLCHPSTDMKNVTLIAISRLAPGMPTRPSALTLCCT